MGAQRLASLLLESEDRDRQTPSQLDTPDARPLLSGSHVRQCTDDGQAPQSDPEAGSTRSLRQRARAPVCQDARVSVCGDRRPRGRGTRQLLQVLYCPELGTDKQDPCFTRAVQRGHSLTSDLPWAPLKPPGSGVSPPPTRMGSCDEQTWEGAGAEPQGNQVFSPGGLGLLKRLCVCMGVCTGVCVHMHVCAHVCVGLCAHVHICVFTGMCACVCAGVCVYICVMGVCMHKCMHRSARVYWGVCVCACTCVCWGWRVEGAEATGLTETTGQALPRQPHCGADPSDCALVHHHFMPFLPQNRDILS